MAAAAEAQHSFREVCRRYVGVARDQGWKTIWTVGGSLRDIAGALEDLALDPEWGGDHVPVWADLVRAPLLGNFHRTSFPRPPTTPVPECLWLLSLLLSARAP